MLLEFPFKYFVSHAFFHLTLTKFQQKKIDEVTDERIVYTFGVQHHMHSQKKKENLLQWFSCSSKNYYQIRIYFLLLLVNYLA